MATRQRICQVRVLQMSRVLARVLARLDDIRQAVLHGLARLAKDEFGEFYANLASLANLESVS